MERDVAEALNKILDRLDAIESKVESFGRLNDAIDDFENFKREAQEELSTLKRKASYGLYTEGEDGLQGGTSTVPKHAKYGPIKAPKYGPIKSGARRYR